MRKVFRLATFNLKKNKVHMVFIGILLLISSVLLNIGFNMIINYGSFFKEKEKEMNAPNLFIAIKGNDYDEEFKNYFEDYNGVTDCDVQDSIFLKNASFDYASSVYTTSILLQEKDYDKELGKVNILEEGKKYW